MKIYLAIPLLLIGLGACAHEQALSPEQLAASEAQVRAAEEAGAEKIPNAALYLKLAREEIIQAKGFAKEGDPRSTSLLGRAQADAELALALAQETATADEAKKLMEEVKAARLQ
jgi:hypothetical protein